MVTPLNLAKFDNLAACNSAGRLEYLDWFLLVGQVGIQLNRFQWHCISQCHAEMAEIPLRDTVPLEAIQLESDLTYEEKPVKILEFATRVTRSKVIKFCKVQWSHHTEDEATWEREEDLLKDHPHLFSS